MEATIKLSLPVVRMWYRWSSNRSIYEKTQRTLTGLLRYIDSVGPNNILSAEAANHHGASCLITWIVVCYEGSWPYRCFETTYWDIYLVESQLSCQLVPQVLYNYLLWKGCVSRLCVVRFTRHVSADCTRAGFFHSWPIVVAEPRSRIIREHYRFVSTQTARYNPTAFANIRCFLYGDYGLSDDNGLVYY